MTEREFKGLISSDTYANLYGETDWDKKILQVNFYFSNDSVRNKNIQIRIRCKNKEYYLQLKVKIDQSNGFRVSEEYKIPMSSIPQHIPQSLLQQAWESYAYGDVYLQGFLVTDRCVKHIDEVDLMLDRNSYNGTIDYEVEMECSSEDGATQLIDKLNLAGKLETAPGKYERFYNTMK